MSTKHDVKPTVHESRLCLFQPTRRPSPSKQKAQIKTSFGVVEIEYRAVQQADSVFKIRALGQGHADLLDACRETSLGSTMDGAGRIVLLVDPARIKKIGGFACSLSSLGTMLDDLAGALIRIHAPEHLVSTGHLLDSWSRAMDKSGAEILLPCPLSQTLTHKERATRHLWAITFGDVGMRLLGDDLQVHYDLQKIVALRTGIAQAVARWIAGQSKDRQPNGGWKLDTIVKAVGADGGSTTIRHRRREIRADTATLAEMGIIINGERVYRK